MKLFILLLFFPVSLSFSQSMVLKDSSQLKMFWNSIVDDGVGNRPFRGNTSLSLKYLMSYDVKIHTFTGEIREKEYEGSFIYLDSQEFSYKILHLKIDRHNEYFLRLYGYKQNDFNYLYNNILRSQLSKKEAKSILKDWQNFDDNILSFDFNNLIFCLKRGIFENSSLISIIYSNPAILSVSTSESKQLSLLNREKSKIYGKFSEYPFYSKEW